MQNLLNKTVPRAAPRFLRHSNFAKVVSQLGRNFLKKTVLRAAPRVLGHSAFTRLVARLGRVADLHLSGTRAKQLEIYPGASSVSQEKMLSSLFHIYYTGGDPNHIVPPEDMASVASYVPYYRGFTSVVLYNFFKSNYGIRDPILYRYSIFNGREVVWCQQFLLPADGVLNIPDPAATIDFLPEHSNVVIEAFHPKISIPSRQLRYFVLYRNLQQGHIAGIHSRGVKEGGLPRLAQPSFRGFGYHDTSYYYHSTVSHRLPLKVQGSGAVGALGKLRSESNNVVAGYMTRESSSGCPTTIWHDGPTPHFVSSTRSGKKVGMTHTAFFVPDFKCHAPLILLSSSQIGFLPQRVTIHLFSEEGKPIAHREVDIKTDDATADLMELFGGENIAGSVNVFIEFDRDIGEFGSVPTAYVHLYYRCQKELADQVHSHSSYGYYDDPLRKPKSYRCRKFGPFIKDSRLEFIYSIVNVGPSMKAVRDDSIRIRIFTDAGSEFVFNRKLSPAGITNIRSDELFADLPIKIDSAAVVQFEHETTNFNGSWYAIDRDSGHLAVDHFTGG